MNHENQYQPLITVYIPTYNYAKYIKTAIKSVLNQTYKNFELIIIDDGSTDKTADILKTITDKRVFVYKNKEKKGLIKSSNIAINHASGDFVIRLDADDWFQSFALQEFVYSIWANPDADLFYCDLLQVHRIGGDIVPFSQMKKLLYCEGLNGAGCLIRKDSLFVIGLYDEEFDCQDGYYLMHRALLEAWEIVFIPKTLYIYYRLPTSLSSEKRPLSLTRRKIAIKLGIK